MAGRAGDELSPRYCKVEYCSSHTMLPFLKVSDFASATVHLLTSCSLSIVSATTVLLLQIFDRDFYHPPINSLGVQSSIRSVFCCWERKMCYFFLFPFVATFFASIQNLYRFPTVVLCLAFYQFA